MRSLWPFCRRSSILKTRRHFCYSVWAASQQYGNFKALCHHLSALALSSPERIYSSIRQEMKQRRLYWNLCHESWEIHEFLHGWKSKFLQILLTTIYQTPVFFKNILLVTNRPSHTNKTQRHSKIPDQSQWVCLPRGPGRTRSPNVPRVSSLFVCVRVELWRLCRDRRVFRQGLPLRGLHSLRTVTRKRKHHMLDCLLQKQ